MYFIIQSSIITINYNIFFDYVSSLGCPGSVFGGAKRYQPGRDHAYHDRRELGHFGRLIWSPVRPNLLLSGAPLLMLLGPQIAFPPSIFKRFHPNENQCTAPSSAYTQNRTLCRTSKVDACPEMEVHRAGGVREAITIKWFHQKPGKL